MRLTHLEVTDHRNISHAELHPDPHLTVLCGPNGQGKLSVAGLTTIAGGTLHVKFVNGYTPKVGDTIAVVDGAGPNRQFASVVVDGFKATAVYTATGIQIRLDA